MTAGATAKKYQKRVRRGRARNEAVYYVFEIGDWDWSLMFGANPSKKDIDPYSDYRHLQIRGTLLRPSKVKADEIELTFLPSHELNEHNRKHHKPNIVGSLQLYRKRLTGLISMPSDALPLVLQMLIAAQFRYVVLSGEKFRHQHAAIRTYRFERAVDEDDLPADV